MSDDPNRPDADHELDVDISAFLPEGSRFATDDDLADEPEAGASDEAAGDEGTDQPGDGAGSVDQVRGSLGGSTSMAADAEAAPDADDGGGAQAVDDGWHTGAPAPEIPAWARDDLPPTPARGGTPPGAADAASSRPAEAIDPGGADVAPTASPAHDAPSDDAPSDDVASDDRTVEDATSVDEEGPETGPAPLPDAGPPTTAPPEVDTTVLTRIEGELAGVDDAIAAIDAGDLARSPLLTELLSADPSPAADPTGTTPPAPH